MPRVPSEVEGVAVEFDPRANAWRVRFEDRILPVREWTWGERRRLVFMAASQGRVDRDLFLDGLFETVGDGSIPRDETGRVPLAVAVLRILGLGRTSKIRPLAAGELLVTRSFGWPPEVLDRQPAGSIDRLWTQLEAAHPTTTTTTTSASDVEPGWNRILIAPRPEATASLARGTEGESGAASGTPAEELAAMMESVASWAGLAVGTGSDDGVNRPVARAAMDQDATPGRPMTTGHDDDPVTPSGSTFPAPPSSTAADANIRRAPRRQSTEAEAGVLPGRARLVAWPKDSGLAGKPAGPSGGESRARPWSKRSPGRSRPSSPAENEPAAPARTDLGSSGTAGIGTAPESRPTVAKTPVPDLASSSNPTVPETAPGAVVWPARESVPMAGPDGLPRSPNSGVGWDREPVALSAGESPTPGGPGEGLVTALTEPRERRAHAERPVAGRSPVAHGRVPMPEPTEASAGRGRWSWPQADVRTELAAAGPMPDVGAPEAVTAEGDPFEMSEFEERLADVLERAASEAGIDLP